MSGDKTHQQQRQIIEKRVDTSNADKDFDPRPYLNASSDVRDRITETDVTRPTDIGSEDGNPAVTGLNQESAHHKKSGHSSDQPQADENG